MAALCRLSSLISCSPLLSGPSSNSLQQFMKPFKSWTLTVQSHLSPAQITSFLLNSPYSFSSTSFVMLFSFPGILSQLSIWLTPPFLHAAPQMALPPEKRLHSPDLGVSNTPSFSIRAVIIKYHHFLPIRLLCFTQSNLIFQLWGRLFH